MQKYELLQITRMFVCLQGFQLFIIQPSITMASQTSFLFMLSSLSCVHGLPEYCYNYYSEFALDEHYNPAIYPEINTTITDITTLYKVSEVRFDRSINYCCLFYTLSRTTDLNYSNAIIIILGK